LKKSINRPKYIYKVCTIKDWLSAKNEGVFNGSNSDLIDGFIHFSCGEQLAETLKKHFKDRKNLCLLKLNAKVLNIKWEKSRNKEFFPHLYGSFKTNCVIKVFTLKQPNDIKNLLIDLDWIER
tara:strand:+ start:120 stop:488 length:369 start_codon:yes stop_codon:yes gene_type:complete